MKVKEILLHQKYFLQLNLREISNFLCVQHGVDTWHLKYILTKNISMSTINKIF
jgi:hypothetical protein